MALVIARYKDLLAGLETWGASETCCLWGNQGRCGERSRGLVTSQGGLAVRGLTGEAMAAGQELGEAGRRLRGWPAGLSKNLKHLGLQH
ncbi:hypothetical protein NN561_008972 [Cricetulus griseus]